MELRADGLPRRSDLTLLTTEERSLFDIMQAIDRLPGDTTAIVNLLNDARERLADYVESNKCRS